MEKQYITYLAVFLYLSSSADCGQYHYDRPQMPFVTSGSSFVPATQPQDTETYYVLKANGGKEFKVHLSAAKQIYEGVVPAAQIATNNIATPRFAGDYHAALATPNLNPLTHGAFAAGNQQHNAAGQYATSVAQYQQSTYNTQSYAAANVGAAAGPQFGLPNIAAATSYSGPSYAGGNVAPALAVGAQYGAPFIGAGATYNGQANAGAGGVAYPAGGAQYGAVSFGGATAYNGQQNAANYYGGAGAEASATTGAQHGAALLGGRIGDYTAQSQVGQLDHYAHKQQTPGDTRGFTRIVTTCSPSGRCEHITLGPGQVDPLHERVAAETRAIIAPASEKCKKIAAAANSIAASHKEAESILKRPQDRRLFPYSESVLPRDAFN